MIPDPFLPAMEAVCAALDKPRIVTAYQGLGFWQAYDADTYDGAEDAGPQCVGYGKTEREAIEDLMEQIEEEK